MLKNFVKLFSGDPTRKTVEEYQWLVENKKLYLNGFTIFKAPRITSPACISSEFGSVFLNSSLHRPISQLLLY